jgi:hypothetical protein
METHLIKEKTELATKITIKNIMERKNSNNKKPRTYKEKESIHDARILS